MAYRDIAVSRGQTVHNFKRSQLNIVPGLNVRDLSTADNQAHIRWLADEIKEKGFTSNIYVFMKADKVCVAQGHCRMAAIDLLISEGHWNEDEQLIPTLLEAKGIGELEIIAGQFTTNGSKPINAREAATNILRIMAMVGQDQVRTAKLIGKSQSYVSQMLTFNEQATPEIHKAIANGEISQSQAATILREEGTEKATKTIQEAVAAIKAKGKAKVTKKDLEPKIDNKTRVLKLALEFMKAFEDEDEEAAKIIAEIQNVLKK